jgi:hypothetical protein
MADKQFGAPLAIAAVAALAASSIWAARRGSPALSGRRAVIEHTLALGTVAKGDTQPIKDLLLRHGFRWLPAADSWYIPGTRRMQESPLDLAALQAEADAILAESSGSNVLEFALRPGREAPVGPPAHMGDVAFLGPDGSSVSMSTLHGRGGPRMGTSAPYAVGRVGPDVVGYADIPTISVDMFGKAADIGVLVPIARQLAMLAADVNGLVINMAPPGLKRGSEKMVEDQNPSSESLGKRKRLLALVFNFEVEGATDPAVKLRDFVQSRHSGGMPALGSSVKPARALTRAEVVASGHIGGGARGSRKLEGWEKIGPMPSGASLHRASRGLYSPRAPEVYGKALASARLPIYVLLADLPIPRRPVLDPHIRSWDYGAAQPLKDELDRRAAELAAQGYTVLVMERPIEKELEAALQRKRGDRFRISSMTPFVILHRMFDTMKRASWSRPKIDHCLWFFSNWTDGFFENNQGDDFGRVRTEQEKLEMGSTGVNTWAGRNGLLVPNEAMSDLWAKYVLTGRIEYDENATRDGLPWHQSEQKMRASFAQCLRTLFPELLELARGKVISLNV